MKAPTFWEADGALRAYANKVSIIAVVLGLSNMGLGAALVFTRSRPPTVISVSADGKASVVGATVANGPQENLTRDQTIAREIPSDIEKKNYVLTFVNQYMGYDQHTISDHWAAAMNMMTSNLQDIVKAELTSSNAVGKYEADHTRSLVAITSMQPDPNDPLMWHVYASRTVTQLKGKQEVAQKLIESYTVRLVDTGTRTELNPSGLLIAEFKTQNLSADNTAPQPK